MSISFLHLCICKNDMDMDIYVIPVCFSTPEVSSPSWKPNGRWPTNLRPNRDLWVKSEPSLDWARLGQV